MKSIKEKKLLVKWARAMNEAIDPAIVEEVERYEQIEKEIIESVKSNTIKDLVKASVVVEQPQEILDYPKPPTLEELLESFQNVTTEEPIQNIEEPIVIEEVQEPEPVPSIAQRVADHITKEVKLEEKADSYQQPDAAITIRGIEDVRRKIKYLEDWIAKISITGPGGGAGDVINLDHPVKLVTSDYTITRKDFYIGVNAASTVNITLPDSIGFPGRMVIIKDESGHCSSNPIVVLGTVDNDTGGFILAQDNGGIQMIYREGWRIV